MVADIEKPQRSRAKGSRAEDKSRFGLLRVHSVWNFHLSLLESGSAGWQLVHFSLCPGPPAAGCGNSDGAGPGSLRRQLPQAHCRPGSLRLTGSPGAHT